ncbi:MAG: DUF1697 domain-containing protein [Rubrivivax sp.]
MPAYVALLRGVNVGSAKRVPMGEWRALLEAMGYTRVATLLNSGNAVFCATGRRTAKAHAAAIAEAIASRLNVQVPVIVKSARELAAIVEGNTMAREVAREPGFDAARLLVAFVPDTAALASLAAAADWVRPPERFQLGPHAAYLYCASGILQSKAGEALLANRFAAKDEARAVTTRNWATTLKLHALASALAANADS